VRSFDLPLRLWKPTRLSATRRTDFSPQRTFPVIRAKPWGGRFVPALLPCCLPLAAPAEERTPTLARPGGTAPLWALERRARAAAHQVLAAVVAVEVATKSRVPGPTHNKPLASGGLIGADALLVGVRPNSEFEEFAPGCWLPRESTWTLCAPLWPPRAARRAGVHLPHAPAEGAGQRRGRGDLQGVGTAARAARALPQPGDQGCQHGGASRGQQ
jgi:hypothetical protein